MAEVNAKDLTTKTTPASTDSMLLFGTTSNEGAKITVDNLADNILGRLTTKTFANQVGGSSAATLLAQLSTLNSNKVPFKYYSCAQYGTVQNGIDSFMAGDGSFAPIYAGASIMSASGAPNVSAYGFAFRDNTNYITAFLFSLQGNLIITFTKQSGTWGTVKIRELQTYTP